MSKRYFEDVIFSRDDIVEFGVKFGPQPFHIYEDVAKKSIFEGLVASSKLLFVFLEAIPVSLYFTI